MLPFFVSFRVFRGQENRKTNDGIRSAKFILRPWKTGTFYKMNFARLWGNSTCAPTGILQIE
jgi:hypothetical protein